MTNRQSHGCEWPSCAQCHAESREPLKLGLCRECYNDITARQVSRRGQRRTVDQQLRLAEPMGARRVCPLAAERLIERWGR